MNNNIPSGLNKEDELLHQPTDELKWRESYYFNWTDLTNKISGFSTIELGLFLMKIEENSYFYYS
ncbi:MAG: hypothetical protein ACTSRT_20355 [Promethearchaeota archaeon]